MLLPLTPATISIHAAAVRAATPLMAVQTIGSLDEFYDAMSDRESLKVVKFVADNCRGCMAIKPKYASLAKKHANSAQFYEINFKAGRAVFGHERVQRTPTVLYYVGEVGRVCGFPFGPTPAERNTLRREFDAVLPRVDALRSLSEADLRPVLRYVALVNVLRAVANLPTRLEEERQDALAAGAAPATSAEAAAGAAAARAASQKTRADEAAILFAWLDGEGKGAITSVDLTKAISALGGPSVFTGRIGAGGGSGLPTEPEEVVAKLDEALALVGDAGALDLPSFTNAYLLNTAHEKSNTKAGYEARAAYALLDASGSGGAVDVAHAAHTIASMCELLPLGDAAGDGGGTPPAECTQPALERVLGTFDFEERGHLHFDAFARVVVRSSPSA